MKLQYVYVDYRRDTLIPFYVGKGCLKRTKGFRRNKMHVAIVKRHGVIRDVIFESSDPKQVSECEKFWIKILQTRVENRGCNFTDGGDGQCGFKSSQVSKEKRRKSLLGKKHTPEALAKIRLARKRQLEDPEMYARFCEGRKRAMQNPVNRAKFIFKGDASPKAIKFTVEQKEMMRSLYLSGVGIGPISKRLNLKSPWPVQRILIEFGFCIQKTHPTRGKKRQVIKINESDSSVQMLDSIAAAARDAGFDVGKFSSLIKKKGDFSFSGFRWKFA